MKYNQPDLLDIVISHLASLQLTAGRQLEHSSKSHFAAQSKPLDQAWISSVLQHHPRHPLHRITSAEFGRLIFIHLQCWEVLPLFDNSAPAVHKNQGP